VNWIKLWTNPWFSGSTRWELTPAERSVWIDILVRAGLNNPPGQIDFFSENQLISQFCITPELYEISLKKFQKFKKITLKKNRIIVRKWADYQSEYAHKRTKKNIRDFNIKKLDIVRQKPHNKKRREYTRSTSIPSSTILSKPNTNLDTPINTDLDMTREEVKKLLNEVLREKSI